MTRKDPIRELLKKYKLDRPLPDGQKNRLGSIRKKSMISILRKRGKYSPFVLIVVWFFFWIKRFGVSLSLGKSAVVVFTAIIITMGAVATSAYYAVNLLLKEEIKTERIKQDVNKNAGPEAASGREAAHRYQIVIGSFEFDPEIGATGRQINNSIRYELIRIKGGNTVAPPGVPGTVAIKNILVGSIIKLDKTYRITAKIIDRSTSRVIYLVSESADSTQDIPRACRALSEKIAAKI